MRKYIFGYSLVSPPSNDVMQVWIYPLCHSSHLHTSVNQDGLVSVHKPTCEYCHLLGRAVRRATKAGVSPCFPCSLFLVLWAIPGTMEGKLFPFSTDCLKLLKKGKRKLGKRKKKKKKKRHLLKS